MRKIWKRALELSIAALIVCLLYTNGGIMLERISQAFQTGQTVVHQEESTDTEVEGQERTDTESSLDVIQVATISTERYVYGTLADEVKQVYDEVLDCILNHTERVAVSTFDKDVLDQAFTAVNADYGGLFWVNGYVYTTYTRNGEITSLEFAPKYTMTYAERNTMQKSIDVCVEQMLSGISLAASDYEKAKYVFETLIHQVDYNTDAQENQNIISAFIYRETVCQGYACATQYLLWQLGIQSFIVTGTANNENHAWNVVRLDGEYYCMDTTWGNSAYTGDGDAQEKFINYNYLNVTTEEINKTHTVSGNIELPECTAVTDNYFVREGLYFTSFEPQSVGILFENSWNQDRSAVSVKFSDEALYQQIKNYFIDEQHIADFCPGISGFSYLEDTSQRVLTVRF